MNRISAVIISKNEERHIEQCIRSIESLVEEIIIIDSGSTDNTEKIARSFEKVKFVPHNWEGYSKTKNYGNSLAKNNWILSIDSDEVLTEELAASIKAENLNDEQVLYRFARLTSYCGQWIKHCHWYPDYQTRLFNKTKTKWIGDSIHEQLENNGMQIKTLKGDCLHYTIYSIEDHLAKVNRYSSVWAREAFNKGKKVSYLALIFKPFFSFLNVYFLKKGFLDGFYGFVISGVYGYSKFQRMIKLKNLYKSGNS